MTRPDDSMSQRPTEPRGPDKAGQGPGGQDPDARDPGTAAPRPGDARSPDAGPARAAPPPAPSVPPAPIEGLPFEAALGELEIIVRRLEGGGVALEDSLSLWERGEALKRHCEGVLGKADARVQRIVAGEGGAVALAPFDGGGAS